MAQLLKGAAVADAINERTRQLVVSLAARGISPTLALLRVGSREDDLAYERSAIKRCEKVGVATKSVALPENVTEQQLLEVVQGLNSDSSVHGVLLFMPLPRHLDAQAVRGALSPKKDVDGITPGSLCGIFTGSGEGFAPCTAQACIEVLDYYGCDCTGKRAVVVGRSLVVGKPVSMLLLAKNATVTICHTKTRDLPSQVRRGDIVIAAAGHAGALGADCFRDGQTIIDVGINFVGDKICGDVDLVIAQDIVSAIAPVPGGVGTVTSSVLAEHVAQAACAQNPT